MLNNTSALSVISDNIRDHGHHVYVVTGGPLPRYMYTIGNSDRFGFELILAGAAYYFLEDAAKIIDEFADELQKDVSSGRAPVAVQHDGFILRVVHSSWSKELMLGVFDYYRDQSVSALQLVPDKNHNTVDTPDMSRPLDAGDSPAWRWLHEPWPYSIPEASIAMTDLAALRGKPVTEVARWEETQWECFAGHGPEVQEEDVRAVSLGTLIALDPSLEEATRLQIGKGLWREEGQAEWRQW